MSLEPCEMRAVRRDHRRAALDETAEDFRFGVRDRLFAAEILDMRGRDSGNHRDMGADMIAQLGDLACMVHPHLEHAETAARRHPRERQRHADMIVVAADRAVRLPPARPFERGEDRFLDARLPDRPGDADDLGESPLAGGGGKRMKRFCRVRDQNVRIIDRPIDQRGGGAIGKRLVEEAVAVHRFALQRHEQIAIADVAAVGVDARNLEIAACRSARDSGDGLRVPQGQRQPVGGKDRPALQCGMTDQGSAHFVFSAVVAAHSRATSTSSKGWTRIFSPEPMI